MKRLSSCLALSLLTLSCNGSEMSSSVQRGQSPLTPHDAGPSIQPEAAQADASVDIVSPMIVDGTVPSVAAATSQPDAAPISSPVANPIPAPIPTPTPEPTNQTLAEETPLSPEAEAPSVIAGAYLTCRPATGGATCEVRQSGALADAVGSKFYVITSQLAWLPVASRRISLGTYFVETNLSVFGVGLSMADKSQTATWVNQPAVTSGLNLVKNGDFESFPNIDATSLFPSGSYDWHAYPVAPATCATPQLDVDYKDPDLPAASGDHFMDLNGACGGQNYAAFTVQQSIPTVAGQLYQVFFSVRPNPAASANHSVYINWDEGNVSSVSFTSKGKGAWTEMSNTVLASSDISRIGFRDPSAITDGAGALLDNVRVFALGKAPTP